ncbi:hypothetical protein [Methylorubrum extorquens]|uniref:Metallo-beta-lactamase domain-containing protein n=1 Tax=Methylorubrum extorquens (strain CM4 / NCIMB 13688) TaxID=440085 RepID=B7L3G7_METC4|nr:hypothetical protein [Methylorubrum extorquens]ACK86375.1 conserved hypothetical protein [Methylorubrum extorquens CM4]
MIFSLDVRRARKGDCLLLHWGHPDDPGLVLIDGGPAAVYRSHLLPRLREIRSKRPDPARPLAIDLLIVSHVDDDHIHGILDLTGELVEAQDERRPSHASVSSCWHNTFEDVIGEAPAKLRTAATAEFGAAALDGGAPADARIGRDAAKLLASLGQGQRLRDDIRKLRIPLNPQFGGEATSARPLPDALDLGRGLRMTVVGPMTAELEALRRKYQAWSRGCGKEKGAREAALAAFSDRSAFNLSSIVALAEVDDRRMLLTGDARGDKILEGLEAGGLLPAGGHLHVDILKVPHHGSANNMEIGFFRRITADHYVFSGNGEHGNPERETVEMLLDACASRPFRMHFTYSIEEIDAGREKEWAKQLQGGRRQRAWSPELDGLAALLKARDLNAAGQSIACVGETAHVIDLLAPLGF